MAVPGPGREVKLTSPLCGIWRWAWHPDAFGQCNYVQILCLCPSLSLFSPGTPTFLSQSSHSWDEISPNPDIVGSERTHGSGEAHTTSRDHAWTPCCGLHLSSATTGTNLGTRARVSITCGDSFPWLLSLRPHHP